MEKAKVLGVITESSKGGQARLKVDDEVRKSLERGEIQSVYDAYEIAVEKRAEVEAALANVMHIFTGDQKLFPHDIHAVRAMRDVAIAAIELARTIATRNGGVKKS